MRRTTTSESPICPQCGTAVDALAIACPKCDADFSHPEGWRPIRRGTSWTPPSSRLGSLEFLGHDVARIRVEGSARAALFWLAMMALLAVMACFGLLGRSSFGDFIAWSMGGALAVAVISMRWIVRNSDQLVEVDRRRGTIVRRRGTSPPTTRAPGPFRRLRIERINLEVDSLRLKPVFALHLECAEGTVTLANVQPEENAVRIGRKLAAFLSIPWGDEPGPGDLG
jgi:hypothetical protein